MTAKKYSKAHEREEARLMRKGFVRSWIGLLLCWLPAAGLLFSIGGFLRTVVRITRRHRVLRRAYLAFSVVVMAICLTVTLSEVWIYSRDPAILGRIGDNIWMFVTGQQPSEDADTAGGTVYTDMDSAGLGVTEGLQEESDGLPEEDWSEWDDDFDWSVWEDTTEFEDVTGFEDATDLEDIADWDDEDLWFEDDSGAFEDGEAVFGEEETGDIVWLDGTEDPAGVPEDDMEWLDENDDGIIWLDENGQELPPETTLYVGAGEQIGPQEK